MYTFKLDDEQVAKLAPWVDECEALVPSHSETVGAAGGRYTYEFTPTGLGLVTVVRDIVTKREINLTDYTEW